MVSDFTRFTSFSIFYGNIIWEYIMSYDIRAEYHKVRLRERDIGPQHGNVFEYNVGYILFIGIRTLLHNVTPVTDTTPPVEAGCLGRQMM